LLVTVSAPVGAIAGTTIGGISTSSTQASTSPAIVMPGGPSSMVPS
jgi:hypothetical protein